MTLTLTLRPLLSLIPLAIVLAALPGAAAPGDRHPVPLDLLEAPGANAVIEVRPSAVTVTTALNRELLEGERLECFHVPLDGGPESPLAQADRVWLPELSAYRFTATGDGVGFGRIRCCSTEAGDGAPTLCSIASAEIVALPEPSGLLSLLVGLVAIGALRR